MRMQRAAPWDGPEVRVFQEFVRARTWSCNCSDTESEGFFSSGSHILLTATVSVLVPKTCRPPGSSRVGVREALSVVAGRGTDGVVDRTAALLGSPAVCWASGIATASRGAAAVRK
jgi:hypothetical protein